MTAAARSLDAAALARDPRPAWPALPHDRDGIRALWRAVLDEALSTAAGRGVILNGVTPTQRRALRRELQREARTWLTSDADDVGCFRWVCELLDLDAAYVRALWRDRLPVRAATSRQRPRF